MGFSLMADLNTHVYEFIFSKLFEFNRISLLHPNIWWFEWVDWKQGDEEWKKQSIEEVSRYGHMGLSFLCVSIGVYTVGGIMCGLALNKLAE